MVAFIAQPRFNRPDGTEPKARVTYAANWRDGLGRGVASADYGTNGGTALTRPDTGAETWSLVQDRTANRVNEITGITESTGPAWVTPAYDPAGNMTTIPKPADPTQGFTAVYDAWNMGDYSKL